MGGALRKENQPFRALTEGRNLKILHNQRKPAAAGTSCSTSILSLLASIVVKEYTLWSYSVYEYLRLGLAPFISDRL